MTAQMQRSMRRKSHGDLMSWAIPECRMGPSLSASYFQLWGGVELGVIARELIYSVLMIYE